MPDFTVVATITIFGSGRLGPTLTALLGLAGAFVGVRALMASRRDHPDGDLPRSTALVLGLAALLLGAVFLAAADSGPGTGDGVVGSGAAIVLGLVAIALDRSAAKRRVHGSNPGGTSV